MKKRKATEFEARVRAALRRAGRSQADLARALGISPQGLRSILLLGNPRMQTLQRVAEALGVEPTELMP